MNNNNNKGKRGKQQTAAQQRKALKNEILNEIRAAAGQPAKGKGRGRRNRQAKQANASAPQRERVALTGRGSTQNRSGYGNKGSMPIWESEYIAEVLPAAQPAFSLQQFPVNPGQSSCFPWLARIAQNFEKYEFEFLDFVYKREVSEFATNGVAGKVIMSFDSDAADPAPTTKQQMEDTDPHTDCMPCENMRLSVPQDILRKFNDAHFVRIGAQPANTDLKTYDIGVLNVACQGLAANTAVGELHVEYALRLRVPILESNLVGVGVGTAAAATAASPMLAEVGVGGLILSQNLLVQTVQGLTIGAEYLIQYTTANAVTAPFSALVGWTQKTILGAGNGTTNAYNAFTATATATTATITITPSGAPGAAVLIVAQLPTASV